MLIEKVHGLQATSITLDARFTMLAKATPDRVTMRQRRRALIGAYNFNNQRLIDQIAWQLERQAKRSAMRYRLGFAEQAPLRRFGSESSLPGLRRSNSFSNLSQRTVRHRLSWRQPNGNLSRSGSVNNLSAGAWRGRLMRGYRRRGGGQRAFRGRFSGGGGAGGAGGGARRGQAAARARPQTARRGNPQWGRGRGAAVRNPPSTKEELDAELDQYMASSRPALDAELDDYMKNAMDDE